MVSQYGGNYGVSQWEFDPEQDRKNYRLWFCLLSHCPAPSFPLAAYLFVDGCNYGMQYSAEKVSLPESNGWDWRLINDYYYCAVIEGNPEEVPQREKVFREMIRPLIENFDEEWTKAMTEWTAVVDYFKARCHPEQLKQWSNVELLELYNDYLVRVHREWWKIHWIWMTPVYGLYGFFVDTCQELTGVDVEDPLFKKLMSGFDNELFHVNKEIWQLGDKAKELGLDRVFLTTEDNEELMSKLEASDAGRKWLEAYHEFVNLRGWRLTEVTDAATPSWIEKPSLGLRDVKAAIAKGEAWTLDARREHLAKEREEAEREIMAKVPADKKDWFMALMRVGQRSSVFSEEHNFYLDYPSMAIGRHIHMEYGRRFAEAGVIDNQEDILFLFPWDISKAAITMGRVNLRPYVERRKEERERSLKVMPEVLIGDPGALPELARKHPQVRIAVVPQRVRPELKADLYGASSAPGVAEGVARIVMNERQLGQVRPGEIVVAPTTFSSWTPVFGIISGVVTDSGGSLSHAVIVAREFGLPAVIGTFEGTRKIKTGDRIRVDGDNIAVYILEKAA